MSAGRRTVARYTSPPQWGTAHGAHAALIRKLGATPIDYQREDFTRVLPGGFDAVFDGIGEEGYRHSFTALNGAACSAPTATRRACRRSVVCSPC